MYGLAVVNNIVLRTSKLLKIDRKDSHHIQTLQSAGCVLYLGLGNHSIMCMSIKASCCVLGIYTVIFVNYFSIKLKNMHRHRQRGIWRSLHQTIKDRCFRAVVILT